MIPGVSTSQEKTWANWTELGGNWAELGVTRATYLQSFYRG